MNVNEIAKKLMHMRENRMTGYIMAGYVREELGFNGYGEALRLRWIEPDMEQSGMITITNHLGKVAEMRQLAAECKTGCNCKGDKCACGCKDGKCTCESVKESTESPGAHFFAQAHAFRRNAVRMGETVGGEAAQFDPDMEAFYAERRPDFLNHWKKHPRHQSMAPEEVERQWGDFESGIRSHLHRTMFTPGSTHHPSYQSWRQKRAAVPPPGPHQPAPGVQIGVNDSLIEKLVQEVATLGLGRTGEAPDTPVIGLGAQSASQAPASSNPLPRPFPQPPGATQQAPLAIGADVGVVENGKQYQGKISRTLPDGKFEVSFAGEKPSTVRPYDKTEVSAIPTK